MPMPSTAQTGLDAPAGRLAAAQVLRGRAVLMTRPRQQAEALAVAIAAAGGVALRFPTLLIEPLLESAVLDAALRRLGEFDLVVFVSANAAHQAQARCHALGVPGLALLRCAAAPGPATATLLAGLGVAKVIAPATRFDSDGLIEAIDGSGLRPASVLILRGADAAGDGAAGTGREQLAAWLAGRGAAVEVVASYRRVALQLAAGEIDSLLARCAPDALVVTSSEGGQRLMQLLGDRGRTWLASVPVFVPHLRIAACMRTLGLSDIHLTPGGDGGIMDSLSAHFRQGRG